MTEGAVAPFAGQPERMTLVRGRRSRLNAFEALERGFALFQATFAQEAWRYYAGSAPLVFCFIPVWLADGQVRMSNAVLLLQALLLAAAYALRAWTVSRYMQRVRQRAFGVPRRQAAGALDSAAAIGRLLAWKITLSAAILAALPTMAGAPWFYSACQFAGLEASEETSEQHSLGSCFALAGQWYGSSLLLFLMFFPLWIAVWLNSFILAIFLPPLLHSIFGVNTLLSTEMGLFALLRGSAFWFSLFAVAMLALDPIAKCTFVIVFQYLRSRREGDDLRGLLASLPREQEKKAKLIASIRPGRAVASLFVLLATILLGGSRAAGAGLDETPSKKETEFKVADVEARVQSLRQAIKVESERAIYQWHEAEHTEPPTWLDKWLSKAGEAMRRGWSALTDFLRKLRPRESRLSTDGNNGGWRLKNLRFWLSVLAVLTLVAAALLFWRRRRGEAAQTSVAVAAASLPDLSNTAVAIQHSEDEWFALAGRLEQQGELRRALRAAHLGLLAGLATREWLTIRRDRTNREYLDEFTRRWRRRPQAALEARAEVPEKLRGSLRLFDQVWYGSYTLTPAAVAAYRQDQQELLKNV